MAKQPPKQNRPRIIRLSIHPLILLTGTIVVIALVAGSLGASSDRIAVQVSDLINGIKQNQYSRVLIQDNGEILAQDKYVVVAKSDRSATEVGIKLGRNQIELKKITLPELISKFEEVDSLEQLRRVLNSTAGSPVVELIVGDKYIIARTGDATSDDYLLLDVTEADLNNALDINGLDINSLGVVLSYTRAVAVQSDEQSIEARAQKGEFVAAYTLKDQVIARVADSKIKTFATKWDGGIRGFAATLQDEGIKLATDNLIVGSVIVSNVDWGDLISILTLVGFLILGFFLFRGVQSSGSGLMKFGQSKARMFWGVKPDITFKDVAGIDEAKNELEEIVQFLRSPDKFRKLGARIPKGVLMVGAPGTGKTLLARAIAGEAGVPFFHTSGSEFEEMLVGAGASRVRDLFEKAKKASPALIFIDEIDAVARKRGTTIQSSTTEQTLNQILVEMDGFEQGTNVIVIAATNRPDVLDPAILRPGRFDRRVVLDLPDIEGRKQILAVHAKNKPLSPDVDLEKVAKRTIGFSGAELENTLNEAAIIAAKNDRNQITAHDIEEAATKVTMGPVRRSIKRTEDEIQLVAVHEAGHALVAKFVPQADSVHRVSILSRGLAGGVTHFLPQDDYRMMSKTRLLSRIVVALGGRAAEEIILGDVSTGASSDINSVTNIVRNMVQKYGMSDRLGLIKYGESNELQYLGYGYGEQRDYSDDTAKMIDEEVRVVVDKAYTQAKQIIAANREKFDKLVAVLLEKEVLEGEDFERLMEGLDISKGKPVKSKSTKSPKQV